MENDFRRREVEKITKKSFTFVNEHFYKEINIYVGYCLENDAEAGVP
jgi:uncharacterized protein (UPF0297 family)